MRTVDHIREAFDTSPFECPSTAFQFTEAVAMILDAAHELKSPKEMQRLFQLMWQSYAGLYTTEGNHTLVTVLGDKYPQLIAHQDIEGVTRAILGRLGKRQPGQSYEDVDISDILDQAGIT